ncbi:proteinaceous RNase P 1, chloroplastic/mitochondrial [Dioscorea cayenensis subsp. rotundata]|uniref:ribonuclease P n=1 Tax=Dioscorea cayennensis subsp. rotundata TaxID=55577 RepID=A0AB40AXF1_DIOCR|nr:proteinaceous RNase P 1, chloroplastic/mitochondrial [Dioscorea cayenensis subsp. rotundata]
MCSKSLDLPSALHLYDDALASSLSLNLHLYNSLLYLCSSFPHPLGLQRGFQIFSRMSADPSVVPNEATFTALARLAAADKNPRLAFQYVLQMYSSGIPPKLRSYGPALFGFCENRDLDGAREVEAHMDASGVVPEEAELAALFKLFSESGNADEVYRILHRMRVLVRRVSESTAEILERWFESDVAAEVGVEDWDEKKVKEGVIKGGGGWHGQGWLGNGRWCVGRSEMDGNGVCQKCGERLVCIDIDPNETEDFARSLSALACQREAKDDFSRFEEWLDRWGPFDAVIDAANVGLCNQRDFNFHQLKSVVNGMRESSPLKKLPLVILHNRRVKGGPANSPNNKALIDSWRKAGVLYVTPHGSNDDWYWLYAAVKCKSLLVTNDEMRDHLFELLGTSFFPRWKEKHQVRLSFSRRGLSFHMPPPYSIVIQESEQGSWHMPTTVGDDIETPRQWVCVSRDAASDLSLADPRLIQMKS